MVPWHIQAATRPSIKYLLPLQQHSTNPAAEPGRSRRKTPRRVARIASPRHRWSTTGRLAAGSAGWASGSSRPAVHALLSGLFFFFFSLRCFGCAPHRSTAGASTTGGGAGSARPAATTSSTATTRPRFGRSSASCSIFPAVFSSLSLLFFDLVLFPMISHAMRLLFLLVPGIGLELDCTQNDGHEVDRRAIESVRFVLVRCIVHALFHSLTSSSSPALQVICLVCDTEQPVRIGLDRAYVVNSILISVCSVQQ
jgi:hypothetical protein